jgi:hypothetical protein
MKPKILLLIVSVILVMSAVIAVFYSYSSAASASNSQGVKTTTITSTSTSTITSKTKISWVVITPEWNSTLGYWVANVAGWKEISVNIENTGGFAGLHFANFASGPYTGYIGGCYGAGQNNPFYIGGECDNTESEFVLTTVVQGAYVGINVNTNQDAVVSIYATNQ